MMAKIKLKLRAKVEVEDGKAKLVFTNPNYYQQQVDQFKGEKYVTVTLENQKSQRSQAQNAYWHGVCYPILSDLTGFTTAEVKKATKALCFPDSFEKKVVMGVPTSIEPTSANFSVSEGVEYTRFLQEKAIELGGRIPYVCEAGYYCDPKLCENPDCPNEN